MIVYHGSSQDADTLDALISRTPRNEREGIYFSLDKKVASTWGNYVYTLAIAGNIQVYDFRRIEDCLAYIEVFKKRFLDRCGFHLWECVNTVSLANAIHNGSLAVTGVADEVRQLLLSDEYFCKQYEAVADAVCDWLYDLTDVPEVYLLPYGIKDYGVIKDISPSVVKLVGKEKLA